MARQRAVGRFGPEATVLIHDIGRCFGLRPAAIVLTLAAACTGGCPPTQQPASSADSNTATTATPATPAAPDPPAPTQPSTPPAGSGGTTSTSGGTPPGSSGGTLPPPAQPLLLNVHAPAGNLRLRVGATIPLAFFLFDQGAQVTSVELVLGRDEDGDGVADGPPASALAIAARNDDNVLAIDTTTAFVQAALRNGYGRLRIGVRVTSAATGAIVAYAPGVITLDTSAPTAEWVAPAADTMIGPGVLPTTLRTTDDSPVTVRVYLDPDLSPASGNETELIPATALAAGVSTLNATPVLSASQPGVYYYYVVVADGLEPSLKFYAQRAPGDPIRLRVTNRRIGDFDLNALADSSDGAILQGFNFNDLAGSSIVGVPDVNGDGLRELLVGARFGKPYFIQHDGVGFGEAYLFYGAAGRLRGVRALNVAGRTVPGLIFPGIRTPSTADIAPPNESLRWTAGLSDIAVIPDMDGDNRPELAFSFPRTESINLGETHPTIQHPDLVPDLPGMGALEYNAFDGSWHPDRAQFTRGGVVIVSSHDEMLRTPSMRNRKSDRIVDLHEVGQLFDVMAPEPPIPIPYIRFAKRRDELPPPRNGPFEVCADCDGLPPPGCNPGLPGDPNACGNDGCSLAASSTIDGREHIVQRWVVQWDVFYIPRMVLDSAGGFFTQWSPMPADPPLANNVPCPYTPDVFPFHSPARYYLNHWMGSGDACFTSGGCEITNEWYAWDPNNGAGGVYAPRTGVQIEQTPLPDCYPERRCSVGGSPPPCGVNRDCNDPLVTVDLRGTSMWSGFFGCVQAFIPDPGSPREFPAPIGARILGQAVDDRFGTALGADGTWLYMSAPLRTPNAEPYLDDVPSLTTARIRPGVVYQLRTQAALTTGGPTRTQLWIEPQPSLRPAPPCLPVVFAPIRPWWPWIDSEDGFRTDPTMPTPHTYMIESVGSRVGLPPWGVVESAFGDANNPDSCPPPYDPGLDAPNPATAALNDYPPGTAGYHMDRTPQIIGPHDDARIEFVRALGDVNGDGVRDFAVGSSRIRQDLLNGAGPTVGGIFIVYGRPTGLEGDYLLEQLALDRNNPDRLAGVLVVGASPGETLARTFADAGDVNGDGFADVLIGNEAASGGAGEAILLFGSPTLESPGPHDAGGNVGGGWTPATIPPTRSLRFVGAQPGDLAGANVAGAGDADGDGLADILIAVPGAAGGRGVVYLVYGDRDLPTAGIGGPAGFVRLDQLTAAQVRVPFARFVGRIAGDFLGGGLKLVPNTDPSGGGTLAASQGLAGLGDLDGDGAGDIALSAMLADPAGRTDGGEVYLLYGKKGP